MVSEQLLMVAAGTAVMPSNSELRSLGRNDLAIQIARRGGFLQWAKRLGLTRKASDSDTGWGGEKDLAEKLTKAGFIVTRMDKVKSPYDLSIENSVRVDVKSARYAEYGACRGWFYRIAKNPQADVIALYQIDTGDCYYLPWQLCPTTNVTISRDGGKYKSFKNREDLLRCIIINRAKEEKLWQIP